VIRIARAKARMRLFDVAERQQKIIDDLIKKTKAAGRDPEWEPLPPNPLTLAQPHPGAAIILIHESRRTQREVISSAVI